MIWDAYGNKQLTPSMGFIRQFHRIREGETNLIGGVTITANDETPDGEPFCTTTTDETEGSGL